MNGQSHDPVANPLTLVMAIKSEQDYAELKQLIEGLQNLPPEQNPIVKALNRIATVHFARFVFLGSTHLAVITTYDGDFDRYIEAFINAIGGVFNQLLVHMADAPPLPVEENRQAFLEFVRRNDLPQVPPFYSAYRGLTVLDILSLRDAAADQ